MARLKFHDLRAQYPVSELGAPTATDCFILWLEAWLNKDWNSMSSRCQLTLRLDPSTGYALPGVLEAWFGPNNIKSVEIYEVREATEVVTEVEAHLCFKTGAHRDITARVIREIGLRKPSTVGEWGVNPLSVLKGLA